MNSDCEAASIGLFSVLEAQGKVSRVGGREDIGVCNFTSSLEITVSRLNGTSPAPLKPA